MSQAAASRSPAEILDVAHRVRAEFEDWRRFPVEQVYERRAEFENGRRLPIGLLFKLYGNYLLKAGAPGQDIDAYLLGVHEGFPRLSCELASVYLQHLLGGEIHNGRYGNEKHRFLGFDDETILDITSDQYGGPKVYLGQLALPWSVEQASGVPASNRV